MTSGPPNAESHGAAPGEEAHFVHEQGGGAHLTQMANDIGNFFRSEPDHVLRIGRDHWDSQSHCQVLDQTHAREALCPY